MTNQDQILQAIYRAVDGVNAELPAGRQMTKAPTTPLYGSQSVLDSLRLVALIVAVEREIEDTLGVAITLADDRALSMERSPFRSIESLSDYIAVLLDDTTHD